MPRLETGEKQWPLKNKTEGIKVKASGGKVEKKLLEASSILNQSQGKKICHGNDVKMGPVWILGSNDAQKDGKGGAEEMIIGLSQKGRVSLHSRARQNGKISGSKSAMGENLAKLTGESKGGKGANQTQYGNGPKRSALDKPKVIREKPQGNQTYKQP